MRHDGHRLREHLLDHQDWLRAFVRRLVAEHDVDDVVQSTWTVALQRADGSPPLLAGIARRLAALLHRGSSRRARREREAARRDPEPATDELVARLEILQRVTATVCALPEPYRTTLLRHHQLGRSIATIAAADGVTAEVVRKRLQRSRAMVRASLRSSLGDDWRGFSGMLALSAGWRVPDSMPAACVKAAHMATAALAVGLILPCAWLLTAATGSREASFDPRFLELQGIDSPGTGALTASDPVAGVRTHVTSPDLGIPAAGVASVAQDPVAPTPWQLVATVRDARGELVQGAIVRVQQEDRWTDAEGIARFALGTDRAALPDRVTARRMVPNGAIERPAPVVIDGLRARFVDGGGPVRVDLQFADVTRSIAGRVLDAAGAPAANVTVFLATAEPLDPEAWPRRPLAPIEDLATPMEGEAVIGEGRCSTCTFATTGPDGSFALHGLRSRDYVLRAYDWRDKVGAESAPVAAGCTGLVLRLPPRASREIRGRLVDVRGVPIALARIVALLPLLSIAGVTDHDVVAEARSGRDGTFTIEVPAQATCLAVREAEWLPIEVALPAAGEPFEIVTDRRHGFLLDLGERAHGAVALEVLDVQERPLPICAGVDSLRPPRTSLLLRDAGEPWFTSGNAAIVRLRDGDGRVLLRVPCALRAGSVVEVR